MRCPHPASVPIRLARAISLGLGSLFLFRPVIGMADCNNATPSTGQTVTCSTTLPNPSTTPVAAVAGSTNVTVNVLAGAELNVSGSNGLLVYDQSSVSNLGTLRVTGDSFAGISAQGTGAGQNMLTNGGLIVTGGVSAPGIFNSAAAVNMLNDSAGNIQTSGASAHAMEDASSAGGGVLTNRGQLSTGGDGAAGMAALANNDTLINNGVITTMGGAADGMFALGGVGHNVITNNGSIDVSGTDAHGILSEDPAPGAITNTGSIKAHGIGGLGAFISGPVTFENAAGASISSQQANAIDANGGGTITNAGSISAHLDTISLAGASGTINNSGTLESDTTETIVMNGPYNVVINNTGNIVGGGGRAIYLDSGNDTFNWSGGNITGFVNLYTGNDTATLTGLTDANLAGVPSFDGGLGSDVLTFNNTQASGLSRLVEWEVINVTNGSKLTLDNNGLTLGDSGTLTGILNIDSTSTLFAGGVGDPAIMPAVAGNLVTVNNAGTIDLTNGGNGTSDALVINGNYVGTNGRLLLQSVLGADGSPSDKLVIVQGVGSGSTAITITNLGGAGALTMNNGILVVQATNGATTTATPSPCQYR